MIAEFVRKWEDNKEIIRQKFQVKHPDNYMEIVRTVVDCLASEDYGHPDPANIKELDFGDYQGCLVYIIPETGYQPSTFWAVTVDYGSCSGCDTLEGIREYSDGVPTSVQVNDYMTLALHIVQKIKRIDND